jgi:hypothetical protein
MACDTPSFAGWFLRRFTLSPAADDRVESSYFVAVAAIFSRNFAISSRFGP